MLAILFGLAGVGKNYTGEIFADMCRGFFWDADRALTPAMQRYIEEKRHFTPEMVDDFCQQVVSHVHALQKTQTRLVVAQAFYRERHRRQIQAAFPEAHFIHVTATEAIILRRLQQRGHAVDVSYALGMRHAFELPLLPHEVISNHQEGPTAVRTQILQLKAYSGLNGSTSNTVTTTP